MEIALLYVSPNGTTRKTTEAIANRMEKAHHRVEAFDLGSVRYRNHAQPVLDRLRDFDMIGFGSPVYHLGMLNPMALFFSEMKKTREKFQFKAFLYITYAGITSGKAFYKATGALNTLGIPVIAGMKLEAPHFHHQEEFPSDQSMKTIERFCTLFNQKSLEPLDKKIFIPDKRIISIIYPFVHFIGQKRELPISILQEKCQKCQKCVRECPVGAMTMEGDVTIDSKKCIHCYHCTISCPFQAIACPLERLDGMIEKNKKIVGMEHPGNRIYPESLF